MTKFKQIISYAILVIASFLSAFPLYYMLCGATNQREAYIKKLQNDKDGIFLISLNEKYASIKVSENDRLDIFGKVLEKSNASAITGHC